VFYNIKYNVAFKAIQRIAGPHARYETVIEKEADDV